MVKALVNQIPEQIRNRPVPVTVGSILFFGGILTAGGWHAKAFLGGHETRLAEIERRVGKLERKAQFRWTVQMQRRFASDLQAGNDMLYMPDVDRIMRDYQSQADESGN